MGAPHFAFEMWRIAAPAVPYKFVILSKAKDLQFLRISTKPG
jgi:hypothetical protein